MADVVEILGKTQLFGSLEPEVLKQVARQMRPVSYASGQQIFERGDEGKEIYIVIGGRVRLSVLSAEGRELSFGHPGPGDVFGEIAAFDGGLRTAHATAVTKLDMITLSRTAFDTLLASQPALARAAIAFLCHRLREADNQFESIALHRIEVRLARFLLTLVKQQHGEDPGPKPAISFGLSQSELALHLGASRPKVNAALMLLEEREAIVRKDTQIICNCDTLADIAEEG
jgi:CRP/FNR family transcriptional regulator, cyclic AMP receptor protein